MKKLIIFGDSHSAIWGGNFIPKDAPNSKSRFKLIDVHYFPGALSYNLFDPISKNLKKWGVLIERIIENEKYNRNNVYAFIMCFGEIDIRTQSIKQAIRLSITINESVEIIANSLIDFCKYIYKKYNIKIFIWNPVATSSPHFLAYNHLYPTVGTEIERNFATEYFSKYTNNSTNSIRSTLKYEIYSFGIYNKLSSFYQTKIEYFEDGCHLNNRGFDMAVESFIEVSTMHNLPNPIDYFSDADIFNKKYQSREITKYVKLRLSSQAENIAQISRHKSGYCFHTNFEKNPHAIIEIEYAANLDKIIIFNRENLYLERASKLQVYAGVILSNLKKYMK